jgi:hypothetical protein
MWITRIAVIFPIDFFSAWHTRNFNQVWFAWSAGTDIGEVGLSLEGGGDVTMRITWLDSGVIFLHRSPRLWIWA